MSVSDVLRKWENTNEVKWEGRKSLGEFMKKKDLEDEERFKMIDTETLRHFIINSEYEEYEGIFARKEWKKRFGAKYPLKHGSSE